MKYPIIKRSFYALASEPAFIFCIVLELAVLLFLVFGVEFQLYQGEVVSITILGSRIDSPSLFVNMMLPNFVGLVITIIVFLFILVSGTVYPGLADDPILNIVLTRAVTRSGFLLSNIVGAGAAGSVNVLIFLLSMSLVMTLKTGIWFMTNALGGAAALSVLLIVILSLTVFFGATGGSATTSQVLVILIHFVLSGLIHSPNLNKNILFKAVSLIVPSTDRVSMSVQSTLLGYPLEISVLVQPLLVALVCIVGSVVIFEKKDL